MRQSAGFVSVLVVSVDDGKSKALVQTETNAVYAQGYLLFVRANTLMAQPFDPKRLELSGEALPLAEGVQKILNTRTAGVFSVAENGLLTLRTSEGAKVPTWFERDGTRGPAIGDPADLNYDMRLSSDQKSLVTELMEHGVRRPWIFDLTRGIRTRLVQDEGSTRGTVWSPDDRSIIYASSSAKKGFGLYRRAARGTGAAELLHENNGYMMPQDVSADGHFLLYQSGAGVYKLWALPIAPAVGDPRKPFLVAQSSVNVTHGKFSPDGRWVAYTSDESGRYEVYATPFPSGVGGKRQISNAGGVLPKWRRDGKELFFSAIDGRIMAAEISTKGDSLEVGEIHALFLNPSPLQPGFTPGRAYEVTGDGKRFLLAVAPTERAPEPITIIQNWAAGLKK